MERRVFFKGFVAALAAAGGPGAAAPPADAGDQQGRNPATCRRPYHPQTRVCSFSHVNTTTGLQMPLRDIAAITGPKGILLVCDGAQAPGMLDVSVTALKVDAYASSSHK